MRTTKSARPRQPSRAKSPGRSSRRRRASPRSSRRVLGALHALLGIGFAVAALRDPTGLDLRDRLLLTTVLATAFVLMVTGSIYTLANGVLRFGQNGCLTLGPPLSDVLAIVGIVVAAIPLVAAVAVAAGGDVESDD